MDFRLFLRRHLELLNALSHWTIRVLFPRTLARAMDTFENAASDQLAKPLQPSVVEELQWSFRRSHPTGQAASGGDERRLRVARKEFRAPRFTALRRRWIEEEEWRDLARCVAGFERCVDAATGKRRVCGTAARFLINSPPLVASVSRESGLKGG